MELGPFRIEQYYAEHEFTARYMLSSSDCESRTVGELLELEPGAEDALRELWCGYTESPGAPALRAELAAGYDGLEPDDVLVTSCAEEGIFLRLPRAAAAGRPRRGRDAVLRVGARAVAEHRGGGQRVAAAPRRRLGVRPRRAGAAWCGRARV